MPICLRERRSRAVRTARRGMLGIATASDETKQYPRTARSPRRHRSFARRTTVSRVTPSRLLGTKSVAGVCDAPGPRLDDPARADGGSAGSRRTRERREPSCASAAAGDGGGTRPVVLLRRVEQPQRSARSPALGIAGCPTREVGPRARLPGLMLTLWLGAGWAMGGAAGRCSTGSSTPSTSVGVGPGVAGSARRGRALATGAGSGSWAAAHAAPSPFDSQRRCLPRTTRTGREHRLGGVVRAVPGQRGAQRGQHERPQWRGGPVGGKPGQGARAKSQ
jgi:hypothetical protein